MNLRETTEAFLRWNARKKLIRRIESEGREREANVDYKSQIIRSYDIPNNFVKDKRTGKTASIKDILKDGKLELLR